MALVLVDAEKAAPPVHNKLNRTLSSASDETASERILSERERRFCRFERTTQPRS